MPIDPAEVPATVKGRRVAVLVSGGIAAYKVADLVSQLAQAGCDVKVAMTASAGRFVGAATFMGLTGHPVQGDLFANSGVAEPHVALGDWAQVALVAPATANLVAKLAGGHSDDLVTATVLAARCPVVVAPAMNDAMWAKPAVAENLSLLKKRGFTIVAPGSGRLASGHTGSGRLAGAAEIFAALDLAVRARYDLAGRRVVVSAGGTREAIDPVRFISNYSSGKMGHAVAEAAADRGADVVLVTTSPYAGHAGVATRHVESADDMLAALREALGGAQLLVMVRRRGRLQARPRGEREDPPRGPRHPRAEAREERRHPCRAQPRQPGRGCLPGGIRGRGRRPRAACRREASPARSSTRSSPTTSGAECSAATRMPV